MDKTEFLCLNKILEGFSTHPIHSKLKGNKIEKKEEREEAEQLLQEMRTSVEKMTEEIFMFLRMLF